MGCLILKRHCALCVCTAALNIECGDLGACVRLIKYMRYVWYFFRGIHVGSSHPWYNKFLHVWKYLVNHALQMEEKCFVLLRKDLRRSQWSRGLRYRPAATRLPGLLFRIPRRAWVTVSCECCVLSGRGPCDGRPLDQRSVRECHWAWSGATINLYTYNE